MAYTAAQIKSIQRQMTSSGSVFGRGNTAPTVSPKVENSELLRPGDENIWAFLGLEAGLHNMTHAPVRAAYNLFNKGDYSVENAQGPVDRFFRIALEQTDQDNLRAQAAMEAHSTGQLQRTINENIVLPLLMEIPAMLQDTAVIYFSGGLSAPTLLNYGGKAKVGQELLESQIKMYTLPGGKTVLAPSTINEASQRLQNILLAPVTTERIASYYVQNLNQRLEAGEDPYLASTAAMGDALNSALLDGMFMPPYSGPPASADAESLIIQDILRGDVGRAGRKAAQGAGEALLGQAISDIYDEMWK